MAKGDFTYEFDLAGRRTTVGGSFTRSNVPATLTNASYNADNQLTQFGSRSMTYDANGNMTSDGVNTYTWDARNHLVSMSGGVAANFQYDAFGRRVSKTIGGTTEYLYDGANPVQELSGGAPSANLLTGLAADEHFQRTDANGPANFLADALGSAIALTSSSGSTVASYTYDPFGNTTSTGSSANSYQYTGRENDGTGLYFYRARYYSPTLQRFASEDPIGFRGGGTNLYTYALNSPTNLRDPSGRNSASDDASWGWNATKSFFTGFSISGRKEKELNQCAAGLSNSFSLNEATPNSTLGNIFLGNTVSSVSQLIFGPSNGAGALSVAVNGPQPLNVVNALGGAIGGISVRQPGLQVTVTDLGEGATVVEIGPASTTLAQTATGAGLAYAYGLVQVGKIVFDAGSYVGALYVCAKQ